MHIENIMTPKRKVFFSVLLIFSLSFSMLSADKALWYLKPKSIYDENFNPQNFRLRDYGNINELRETVAFVFAPGTEKEYIEGILGKYKDIRKRPDPKISNKFYYVAEPPPFEFPNYFIWILKIKYNDNEKMETIEVSSINYPFARFFWEASYPIE